MSTPVRSARPAADQASRAAVASPAVVPAERAGPLAQTFAFAWRTLLKIKHTPEQLFDAVITPIMFTVLFTYMFGGAIAGSVDRYLQFLLPGIIVQTATFATIYTGFNLNNDITKGIYDRFRSMPLWQPAPLVGAMLGDTVRYSLSSLIVVLVGLAMGYRPEAGALGVVAAIAMLNLFALGIGWVFTAIALLVRTPGTFMTIGWTVLFPLTFASNIYVEIETMPAWLQSIVVVNPVTLITSAVRGILDGNVTMGAIGLSLLAPAAIAALCGPLAMALYRRER